MALSDDLKLAQEALAAGQKFTYKGKTYTLTQLRDKLIPDLQKQVNAEEEAAAAEAQRTKTLAGEAEQAVNQTKLAIDRAKSMLPGADTAANNARRDFNSGAISESEYTALLARPAQIRADIEKMETGKALGQLVGSNQYSILAEAPVTATQRGAVAPRRATAGMRGEGGAVTPVVVPDETPTSTTPTETTPITAPKVKGAKKPAVAPDAWKDILRQNFPSYSNDWLTDNAITHFGQDVIDLMVEAANPNGRFGGLKTDEGKAAYDKALRQTSYFLNTETAARAFDQATPANQQALVNQKKLEITADLGDVGLDEQTLNKVAAEAARKGLTGLGLSQAVYANILKPSGAPTPLATRALEAADADRIRKIGRAYNYNVTDDELKSILTGAPTPAGVVLTEEGLRQKAQNYAKGVMPQLADQIDRGLTLEEIGGNYSRYAAQILEQTEDQIDMFSGPYLQAFGNKETGQLSLGDWVERLKSDSRFGWQYTKQANQQATDVALSIARAFGKVQ